MIILYIIKFFKGLKCWKNGHMYIAVKHGQQHTIYECDCCYDIVCYVEYRRK